MLQDLNNFVQLFVGLSMLLVLLGGSYVVLKSSVNKATVSELRGSLEDARKDNAELRLKQDADHAKLMHLEDENKLLKALVTQKANVDAVLDLLEEHHRMAMKKQEEIMTAIRELRASR